MNKNRIRLTESQLHRVIKESVNKVLNEWLYPHTEDKVKDNEMNSMWRNYGNVNRLDNYSTEEFDEPLGISAQRNHDSLRRSGARGFRNGTRLSADLAADKYFRNHQDSKNFRWK